MRFWSVLADDTGRVLSIDVPAEACQVPVSAVALEAALDVLIDNVLSHTPSGLPSRRSSLGRPVGESRWWSRTTARVWLRHPLRSGAGAASARPGSASTWRGARCSTRGGAIRFETSSEGGARIVLAFPSTGLSQLNRRAAVPLRRSATPWSQRVPTRSPEDEEAT